MIYLHQNTIEEYDFLPRKRAKELAGLWEVRYADENGESVLARTETAIEGSLRLKHFQAVLVSGRLLTPDKSASL